MIYIDQSINTASFAVNYKYSNLGTSDIVYISSSLSSLADSSWHHYAIVAINDDTGILFQLFQDGALVSEQIAGTIVEQTYGPMNATIGSLIAQYSSESATLGYGKLFQEKNKITLLEYASGGSTSAGNIASIPNAGGAMMPVIKRMPAGQSFFGPAMGAVKKPKKKAKNK